MKWPSSDCTKENKTLNLHMQFISIGHQNSEFYDSNANVEK